MRALSSLLIEGQTGANKREGEEGEGFIPSQPILGGGGHSDCPQKIKSGQVWLGLFLGWQTIKRMYLADNSVACSV